MNYNEIIQKAGKKVTMVASYEVSGVTTTLDQDDLVSAKLGFKTKITGTVMKSLELETKVPIPKEVALTLTITASFKTYTATKTYTPYYLHETTYNADKKTYTNNLYDGFLPTMTEYGAVSVTYPTTLLNFFLQLVQDIGLTTDIVSLPNGSRILESDPYVGINYTYRDVLDDIGNATATLFKMDGTVIKKQAIGTPSGTPVPVIDDDIIKNVNADIYEQYGQINTVVLSRGGYDNIYYPAVLPSNPIEYKITDNILMNNNDRSDYIEDIYDVVNGLQYTTFDLELTGYGGFEPLETIRIETGSHTYTSYVFNNEITIDQGYSEAIYTHLSEEEQTDYKVADTTDKRINQTYIIVDKQLGEITTRITNTENDVSQIENTLNNVPTMETITNLTNSLEQIQTSTYTKTEIQQIASGLGYTLTNDTNFIQDKNYYQLVGTTYTLYTGARTGNPNELGLYEYTAITAVISNEARFDKDGMHYSKSGSDTTSTINDEGLRVDGTGGNELFFAGVRSGESSSVVESDNLTVDDYLVIGSGYGRFEQYTDDNGNDGVGFFMMKGN